MKTILYALTEETYTLPEDSSVSFRRSYGIAAYTDWDTLGTASIVASVHDISEDREQILNLVRVCNQLDLSPMHLPDVVQDFLVQ